MLLSVHQPVLTDKGCESHPHPFVNVLTQATHQGRIFFKPFFLLLDSFWFLSSVVAGVCVGCDPSVFVASVLVAVPSVAAGVVAEDELEPSVGVEVSVPPLAGGVLAESGAPEPEVELFTSSDAAPVALPAGAASPGFTVATTPDEGVPVDPAVPPTNVARPPPFRTSVPASVSLSPSIVGTPLSAAA